MLAISGKEGCERIVDELALMMFGFRGGSLGDEEGSGVRVERTRRLIISYSCLSRGDVLIIHLTMAASCGVIKVSLSFFMVSWDNYLYQKNGKG